MVEKGRRARLPKNILKPGNARYHALLHVVQQEHLYGVLSGKGAEGGMYSTNYRGPQSPGWTSRACSLPTGTRWVNCSGVRQWSPMTTCTGLRSVPARRLPECANQRKCYQSAVAALCPESGNLSHKDSINERSVQANAVLESIGLRHKQHPEMGGQ